MNLMKTGSINLYFTQNKYTLYTFPTNEKNEQWILTFRGRGEKINK